jgi:hypothetical protein
VVTFGQRAVSDQQFSSLPYRLRVHVLFASQSLPWFGEIVTICAIICADCAEEGRPYATLRGPGLVSRSLYRSCALALLRSLAASPSGEVHDSL